jgi:hypothetical protein
VDDEDETNCALDQQLQDQEQDQDQDQGQEETQGTVLEQKAQKNRCWKVKQKVQTVTTLQV